MYHKKTKEEIMLNQVVLVGRVSKLDKQAGIVSISIKRPKGTVSDLVPVSLKEELMSSVSSYLTEGATIGVKATLSIENNILKIAAEKLSFINKKYK
jgi:hypothetical protein